MANYLSNEFEVSPVKSSINLPLLSQVMGMRQGTYDANKARVDQTLALYQDKLKGRRDIDNNYIASKLSDVRTSIDQTGDVDWSRSYNTDGAMNKINSLVKDPVIMSAVLNKAKVDQYNAEVAKLKEKDNKNYNDRNYSYGLYKAGVDKYDKGEVNDIGELRYIPYTDLTEEHFKKLKTIKEIKGKRVIEEQAYDSNGQAIPGKLISREIDGMTASEIQKYFGSIMTSQELMQLRIDGWAKYGQEDTKPQALEKYKEYDSLILKQYENDLEVAIADSKNTYKEKSQREQASRTAKELQESINDLKNKDYSKIDAETIGFELERLNYTNGISQLAGAEWSTTQKKDDWYFESQKLDIDRQKLEIDKLKAQKENKTDASGNPILDGVVSMTPAEGELEKVLSEEEAGAKTLEKEQERGAFGIVQVAKDFLSKASKADKESFEKYLSSRGVGSDLTFKREDYKGKYSLSNTIYEAFKQGNFDVAYPEYAKNMKSNYTLKKESAQNILKVEQDAYREVFQKDPDKYINFLKKAEKQLDPKVFIVSDVVGDKEAKKVSSSITNLVKQAGGWDNMKDFLNKNPNKLREFANLTDIADKTYKGVDPYIKAGLTALVPTSVFWAQDTLDIKDNSLKVDASAKKEELIQKRTKDGVMMSAYNQFNILDEKLKEKIVGSVSVGEVTSEDGETKIAVDFDPKKPITVSRDGDKVVIRQTREYGSGQNKSQGIIKYVLNPQSSAYAEISKYVDLKDNSSNYIRATKDIEFEEVRPKMSLHTNNTDLRDRKVKVVASTLSPQLYDSFSLNRSVNPIENASSLSTKDTAEDWMINVMTKKGIPLEKATQYTNKLLNNINKYTFKIDSTTNFNGDGYEFRAVVTKPNGDELFTKSFGVDTIDKNTDYLFDNYPQIFILNQKLSEALQTPNKIDNLIQDL